MRLRTITAFLIAVSLSTALAAPPPQQQKTALVTAVAEASGKLGSLKAADFVVKEDGTAREVLDAAPATEPLFITILVDMSQPPAGVIPPTQDLRRALSAFVQTIKTGSPDAQLSMVEIATAGVTKVDFTSEAEAIEKNIQKVFPGNQTDAALIETIVDAGKKLSDKPSPRRAIVSVDFNSKDTSAERTMRQAAESIRKAGATLWSVSVRGNAQSSSNREEVLNVVSKSSGGLRLTAVEATGLETMLKSVANSLLSQYTVTFVRPGSGSVKGTEMQTKAGGKVLVTPWMR
jgi:hypothetical protein